MQKKLSDLVIEADLIKSEHPGCGVEKLYYTLEPNRLGRDKFIDYFMDLGYRVKRIRNYIRTTIPVDSKYQNFISGMLLNDRNQVWQTDITYYHVGHRFYYITFIIDVYTKKIVSYQVSDNLRAEANLKALRQALKMNKGVIDGLIHHSDRGSQYTEKRYTGLLAKNGVSISMSKKAQDNAYAERINGIIKNEYLAYKEITGLNELKKEVKKAVKHYNNKRLHRNLPKWNTPIQFEEKLVHLSDQNRPKELVYAEENCKIKKASSFLNFRPEIEPQKKVCPIICNY